MNTLLLPLNSVEETVLSSKNLTGGRGVSCGSENHSDTCSVAGGTSGGRVSATLGILIEV